MRKQWSNSPNVRGLPEDYPIDETDADISPLMFTGVGGSMLIFAGAWPRMLPSDFRVRSLDGVADDWPLTYDELAAVLRAQRPRTSACPGMGGDPAYPARGRGSAPAAAADGRRRAQGRAGPHAPGLALVAGAELDPLGSRTTAAARASSAARASRAATRAPRPPPTSRTGPGRSRRRGWSPAPGCGASRPTPQGLATGATWLDRDGHEHFAAAKVVVLAANAIGTAAAAAPLGLAGTPTVWPTPRGSSASG